MTVGKALCGVALVLSGLLALLFLLDLALAIPFGRFSVFTDLAVIIAAGLIIWQTVETYRELK